MINVISRRTTISLVLLVLLGIPIASGVDDVVSLVRGANQVNAKYTYGGLGADTLSAIIKTHNNELICLGSTNSSPSVGDDFWLLKLGLNGTQIWDRTISGPRYDSGSTLIETEAGDLVLAGVTTSSRTLDLDIWLIKTDQSGAVVWGRSYGGLGFESVKSLIQTKDGGFALLGTTTSSGVGYGDLFLLRVNETGSLMWSQNFGSSSWDYPKGLIETEDGGFVILGWFGDYLVTDDGNETGSLLIKTNKNGNLTWVQKITDNWCYAFVQASEEEFIVLSEVYVDLGEIEYAPNHFFGGPVQYTRMTKTDLNGSVKWDKIYNDSQIKSDQPMHLLPTIDGGYLFLSYTEYFLEDNYHFHPRKIDQDGNLEWEQIYDLTGWITSLLQLNDESYIMVGNIYSENRNYDAFIVKVTENGILLWTKSAVSGFTFLILVATLSIYLTWKKKFPRRT